MWAMIALYAGAMVLIVLEFVLPGGILGGVGVIMALASAAIGIFYYPEYTIVILVLQFVGLAISLVIGYYILSRTSAGKSLMLSATQRPEDGYTNLESNRSLVGQRGIVTTALRPAGTIEVGTERLDAVTEGTFIDSGETVRVLEVHGNRIVVESVEPSEDHATSAHV